MEPEGIKLESTTPALGTLTVVTFVERQEIKWLDHLVRMDTTQPAHRLIIGKWKLVEVD